MLVESLRASASGFVKICDVTRLIVVELIDIAVLESRVRNEICSVVSSNNRVHRMKVHASSGKVACGHGSQTSLRKTSFPRQPAHPLRFSFMSPYCSADFAI